MTPLVSAIVPTYNRTRLLVERCLPSILAQTVEDFELLVVGDGTERATVRAMRDLERRDRRVRFWNLRHPEYPEDIEARWRIVGLGALNFALDHARGEWIAVLADDDEWTPDHLEVLLAEAERTGADHVYGMSDTWKDGKLTEQLYGMLPPEGPGHFCNGANIYRAALGYRYDLGCGERAIPGDQDLWDRMVADGVRFAFLPQIVHHYHRNFP